MQKNVTIQKVPLLCTPLGAENVKINTFTKNKQKTKGISSDQMRQQVMVARNRQLKRFEGTSLQFNSQLDGKAIEKFCFLEKEASCFLFCLSIDTYVDL